MALTPTSFATPDQMEDRSGGAILTTHPFLQKELAAATRQIRNRCGWHIATRQQVRIRHVRPFPESVWLPAMQIESIDSAIMDGATRTTSGIDFDPDTGWTPLCGRRVDVTFTAGFDEVPEDLVTLTLELAAGALGSPLGITREQAGGVSVTLARSSGALQADDLSRLAAYKLGWLP